MAKATWVLCLVSHSEHTSDEVLNMLWALLLNKGRCKHTLSHGLYDKLRVKKLHHCLPGYQCRLYQRIYEYTCRENKICERLSRNFTSVKQTAVHARNFCHEGTSEWWKIIQNWWKSNTYFICTPRFQYRCITRRENSGKRGHAW